MEILIRGIIVMNLRAFQFINISDQDIIQNNITYPYRQKTKQLNYIKV